MSDKITFRYAEEKDIDGLVNLMNNHYARKYNAEYFKWQIFNSKYQSVLMCAFNEDDKPVATIGGQKKSLSNGAVILQPLDLLIQKEYRGRGIFRILYQSIVDYYKDFDIELGFANGNGVVSFDRFFEWKTIVKVDELILPVNKDFKLKSIKLNQEILIENNCVRYTYNDEIRNWRFLENPLYKYKIFKKDNNIIVVKVFTDPVSNKKYGDIVETSYENSKILELLQEAIEYLILQNINFISTWALKHTSLYNIFKSIGFVEEKRERYFCGKVVKKEYDFLNDAKSWELFQADAEIY